MTLREFFKTEGNMKSIETMDKSPNFRWVMLLLNVLAYGQFFLTVNVPIAFRPYIMRDLSIGMTQAQLFNTIMMVMFAFIPGIGAKIAMKVGLRKNVAAAIICNIVGALLIPVIGHSFFGYGICCVLQGLCGGLMAGSMISSTSLWFPERQRGLAAGILLGILGVGFSIATFFAPRMIAAGLSWQMAAALLSAVPAAVILVIYYIFAREVSEVYPGVTAISELIAPQKMANECGEKRKRSADSPKAGVERPATMAALRRTRMFYFSAFAGFVSGCMSYGFPVFVSDLMTQDKGMDPMMATTISSITFFVTIIAAPLGGIISDRIFKGMRWQTVCLSNALIVVTLLAAAFSNGVVLAVCMISAYFVAALSLGPFWAMPAELGTEAIATEVAGIINVFGNTGGVVIGFVLTALAALTGTYYTCLGICVILAAVNAYGITTVKR